MKTFILADNWGAYFYPWANTEHTRIVPPNVLDSPPGLLEQCDKIILINGIKPQWLFHPRWTKEPRINSYFFLWDPARCPHYAPTREALEQLKNLHKCYSFQEEDCQDFGLHFNSTMYVPPPLPCAHERYDVLFLGVPKDRLHLLRELHKELSAFGLRLHFRIATLDQKIFPEQKPGWLLTHEWLSYPNYLSLVAQSRCLLDLYQSIQTGYSLRVMEHIYFGKKLLTNNRTIKQAAFYHSNNIFVLGEDENFVDWLGLPFVPIHDTIKEYYSLASWIGRFA